MRTCFYFIAVALFYTLPAHMQTIKNYEEGKKVFFPLSDPVKIKCMEANWHQYFKEDVAIVLDPTVKSKWVEVKLDSYGSPYPDKTVQDWFSTGEFNGNISDYAASDSHSFYFLWDTLVKRDLDKRINAMSEGKQKTLFKQLLAIRQQEKTVNIEDRYVYKEQFRKEWNDFFIEELANKLNAKIKADTIKRIVFFIHGFNVPYSLAALQAVTMYQKAKKDLGADSATTLFVPVYWPSNDAKECRLSSRNFSTANYMSFNRNGMLFLIYSTRCYYAAFTLRKILNRIDPSVKQIDMIAHSLGNTIVTSALINTVSKIDYQSRKVGALKYDSLIAIQRKVYLQKKDPLSYDLLVKFKSEPLPKRKINCFLSAAAIPGLNTFTDLDTVTLKHTTFHVTINQYDEMLTKSSIQRKLHTKVINASNMGATTLGCNYKCEAGNTERCFNFKFAGVKNKTAFFRYKTVSMETDHDIFTYLQQPDYRQFYSEFLKLK